MDTWPHIEQVLQSLRTHFLTVERLNQELLTEETLNTLKKQVGELADVVLPWAEKVIMQKKLDWEGATLIHARFDLPNPEIKAGDEILKSLTVHIQTVRSLELQRLKLAELAQLKTQTCTLGCAVIPWIAKMISGKT